MYGECQDFGHQGMEERMVGVKISDSWEWKQGVLYCECQDSRHMGREEGMVGVTISDSWRCDHCIVGV